MIDFENELFTTIATSLRSAFSGIFVTGEILNAPTQFPCVMITQADNYCHKQTQDSTNQENHVVVMFEFDVYSNKVSGKKSEAKAITKHIDSIMLSYGFNRLSCVPVPNVENATIYRMVSRYEAISDTNNKLYRR